MYLYNNFRGKYVLVLYIYLDSKILFNEMYSTICLTATFEHIDRQNIWNILLLRILFKKIKSKKKQKTKKKNVLSEMF